MTKKLTFILFGTLCAVVLVLTFIFLNSKEKNAWVDTTKVYNEFHLKKELENQLKNIDTDRKKILDSLELELTLLSKTIQANPKQNESNINHFQQLKESYLLKREQFEEDHNNLSGRYNEQILTQINQYVKDYGKEHHYIYIHGANGTGSLMFADEKQDITSAVIEFINKKYKGEK